MNYQKEYLYHKTKYARLMEQFGSGPDDEDDLTTKDFDKYYEVNDPERNKMLDGLNTLIRTIDVNVNKDDADDESIIDSELAKYVIEKFIKYEVVDNMICFVVVVCAYHIMNIQGNVLSLPGLSIRLKEKYEDIDTRAIQKIIESEDNKIIYGKHIVDMPDDTSIKGILLGELVEIIGLKGDINKKQFGIKVILTDKDIPEKLKSAQFLKDDEIFDSNEDTTYKALKLSDIDQFTLDEL